MAMAFFILLFTGCRTAGFAMETLNEKEAPEFLFGNLAEVLDFLILLPAGYFISVFIFKRRTFLKIMFLLLPAVIGVALLDQYLGYRLNQIWIRPELFFEKICLATGLLVGFFAGLGKRPAEKALADKKKKNKNDKTSPKKEKKSQTDQKKENKDFPQLTLKEKRALLNNLESTDEIISLLKKEPEETLREFILKCTNKKVMKDLIPQYTQLKKFNEALLLEISQKHPVHAINLLAFKLYKKDFDLRILLKERFKDKLVKSLISSQIFSSGEDEFTFLLSQNPQKGLLSILKNRYDRDKIKELLEHWEREAWYYELYQETDPEKIPLEERLTMLKGGNLQSEFREALLSSLSEEEMLNFYQSSPEAFEHYDINRIPVLSLDGMEDFSEVEILQRLDARGDVDAGNSVGASALFVASHQGKPALVQKLLDKGADANKSCDNGAYPLYVASQEGHKAVMELLLKSGADVNHIALAGSPLTVMASEQGKKDLAQLLLNHGAEIDHRDEMGCSALYYASQNGNRELVEYLLSQGAKFNISNREGGTPLFIASQQGHLEIVKKLLNAGADPSWALASGLTPLEIAENNGHKAIAALLGGGKKETPLFGTHKDKNMARDYLKNLGARAKKEKVYSIWSWVDNRNGETCYQFIPNVSDSNDFEFDSPSYVTEKTMLYEAGTMRVAGRELAGDEKESSPVENSAELFEAVESGNLEKARKLLEQGANPQTKGGQLGYTTVLQEAAEKNNYDMVNLLLEKGADINYQDTEGFPLISLVAHNPNDGTEDMIRYLVNREADLYASTARGRTAIQIIRRHMPDFDMIALACPHCSGKVSSRDPNLLLNIRMLFNGGMISGGTIPCAACGNRSGLQDWHQASLQRFGEAYRASFSED